MSRIITGRPTAWTWILATLIVIALLWVVFAAIARNRGSRNDTLPHANIPAASMVAQMAAERAWI